MKRLSRQTGISLVEILVAMVISLFLLGGIIQVYAGNRATFAFTNSLAEIQENARFALDTMSQDLRLAGDWGCVDTDPDSLPIGKQRFFNVNDTLGAGNPAGYDNNLHDFTGPTPVQGTNDTGLNGSDTLIVRGGKPGKATVQSPFQAQTNNRLVTDGITSIVAGDLVLVMRCGTNQGRPEVEADILRVTDSTPLGGGAQRQLEFSTTKSQIFQNDAAVIELQTVTYTVANGASGEPALFRQEFNAAAEELIEGVDDMQILYGVDSDDDGFANQYMPANNVANFDNVASVRIMLLLRSVEERVTETPQTYTFNGVTTTAGDTRLRQVFTATVALRNRLGR